MAKALFRFLRGELNGYYLTNIHNSLNEYSKDIKDFFIEFQNQQFELGKISEETLYNLGKFASVFLPRRPVSDTQTAMYMSDSHVVNDTEFSERGLFDTDSRTFDFVHTDPGITSPDINTLATENKRSSLVGNETVEGYISSEAIDVLDDDGKVRQSKVLPEPPSDVAYSDFYGNEFLFLSEGNVVYENVAPSLFIELFKALQWIRYNGVSIASLLRVIGVLCPEGLVQVDHFEVSSDGKAIYVYYVYNPSSPVTNKESRIALLQYIIDIKFKQMILSELQ